MLLGLHIARICSTTLSFDQVYFKHKQPQVLSPDSHATTDTIQQTQEAANVGCDDTIVGMRLPQRSYGTRNSENPSSENPSSENPSSENKQPQVLSPDSHATTDTIQQTTGSSQRWVWRHNSRHAAWPTVIRNSENPSVINAESD